MFGCAAQQKGQVTAELPESGQVRQLAEAPASNTVEHNASAGKKLVKKAKSAMGTPYVRGGTNPGGFDCSGFVKWTYNSIGVDLPRTAREQSTVGKKIRKVEDMREGDIVAFNHPRRGYHTGIYVGDGKFIHSPRQKSTVRINSLSDPYYNTTFLGARRVNVEAGEKLVAQATSGIDEYSASSAPGAASAEMGTIASNRKSTQITTANKSKGNIKNIKATRAATKSGAAKRLTKSMAENTAKKTSVVSMLQPKKTSAKAGRRS